MLGARSLIRCMLSQDKINADWDVSTVRNQESVIRWTLGGARSKRDKVNNI